MMRDFKYGEVNSTNCHSKFGNAVEVLRCAFGWQSLHMTVSLASFLFSGFHVHISVIFLQFAVVPVSYWKLHRSYLPWLYAVRIWKALWERTYCYSESQARSWSMDGWIQGVLLYSCKLLRIIPFTSHIWKSVFNRNLLHVLWHLVMCQSRKLWERSSTVRVSGGIWKMWACHLIFWTIHPQYCLLRRLRTMLWRNIRCYLQINSGERYDKNVWQVKVKVWQEHQGIRSFSSFGAPRHLISDGC